MNEESVYRGCAICSWLKYEFDTDPHQYKMLCDEKIKARCTKSTKSLKVKCGEPYVTVQADKNDVKDLCSYIPDWCPLRTRNKPAFIDSFTGDYFFLSNYYRCKVMIEPYGTFYSSEAAYQAMKCPDRFYEFLKLGPDEAKKLGKQVPLRSDWDNVKDNIMMKILCHKFNQNQDLAKKLLGTGNSILIEGNTWGDKYWGQVDGEGENNLGKLLMALREFIKIKENWL